MKRSNETAIQRVARQCREKEAVFYEKHGMSSAEYFHESGYSDADSERIALEELDGNEETTPP
jgi:hypothetical protein